MKKLFLLVLMLLVCGCLFAAKEEEFDPNNDNIYVYTTWDENYFYVGCDVQTPYVIGKNKLYNAPIGDDDGIEILLDTEKSMTKKINENCISFAASCAGGFELKRGTKEGLFVPMEVFNHKIAAKVLGTLNNKTDIDKGFVIEFAIPWDKICEIVPQNRIVSFTYKVRAAGKDYYLTDKNNFYNPSAWYDMQMSTYTSTFRTKIQNRITCGSYMSNPPVIDGEIRTGEWNTKTRSNIKIPINKELYELNFKSQKIIAKDLVLPTGNTFFNNPKRIDVIKNEIEKLDPIDALYVPVDDNLANVYEACKSINNGSQRVIPIIPVIAVDNTDQLIEKINKYLLIVPNQYRLIMPNKDFDKSLYIRTNLTDWDQEKIDTAFDEFKIEKSLDYKIDKRIVSEYGFIITNYTVPKSIGSSNMSQMNFIIKNVGSLTWKPAEVYLKYKWYKNNRFYSQGFAPIPIMETVEPGETLFLNTSVIPMEYNKKMLQEGDIIMEAEVTNGEESLITSQSIMLKTSISDEPMPEGLKVIAANVTNKMELGSNYDISLDIMNNTGETISKETPFYVCLGLLDKDNNLIKDYKDNCIIYPVQNIDNGMNGVISGEFKFKQSKKDPKELSEKYVILVKKEKDGEILCEKSVSLIKNDINQKLILDCEIPNEITVNSKLQLKIIVRNAGEKTWPISSKLIADWYNKQGQIRDNGGFCNISKKRMKPGDMTIVNFEINAPSSPGDYFLNIGTHIQTMEIQDYENSRNNDLIVVPCHAVKEK